MLDFDLLQENGLVWMSLGPDWPAFSDALADSVSALSPRGESPELSTYWIDHALAEVDSPPGTEVAGGNATRIVRTEHGVGVCSSLGLEEDNEVLEEMDSEEFVRLLRIWRAEITRRVSAGDRALPEQALYQRNPY